MAVRIFAEYKQAILLLVIGVLAFAVPYIYFGMTPYPAPISLGESATASAPAVAGSVAGSSTMGGAPAVGGGAAVSVSEETKHTGGVVGRGPIGGGAESDK